MDVQHIDIAITDEMDEKAKVLIKDISTVIDKKEADVICLALTQLLLNVFQYRHQLPNEAVIPILQKYLEAFQPPADDPYQPVSKEMN